MSPDEFEVIGIDPGLVHTGIAGLVTCPRLKTWVTWDHLVVGKLAPPTGELDVDAIVAETKTVVELGNRRQKRRLIVIEAYKPRSHFDTDATMGRLVNDLRKAIPGSQTLVNTGVKQVVRPPLMKLLGLWNFSTPTHHQDLRSAARIGLYGALKDEELNAVLTALVTGVIDDDGWDQTS